jgi:hypothetical protein
MHRWISVPLEEAKAMKEQKKVEQNSGYHYKDRLTQNEMVEFHVNTCRDFIEQMNKETVFGGNLPLSASTDCHGPR